MNLIAKHLDRTNLKYPIHQVSTQCAFTGKEINEAIKLDDLVSDVFTDWEHVKYPTEWVSIEAALCIGDVLPGKTRNNALRNYSYFACETGLKLLSRESILELLLNIPEVPFVIAVSFNNKKHTSYKTVENTDVNRFKVTTDIWGNVAFDRYTVNRVLPIMQRWYCVIPEKAGTAAQPTYFTKDEIRTGIAPYFKQVSYGLGRFEEENTALLPYRDTHLFNLLIHLLNKTLC